MIILLVIFNQAIDLDNLYHTATTLLVQFSAVRDSAYNRLIELAQDTAYSDTTIDFLVSHFDTKLARERHVLKNLLKEIGQPAIKGIVRRIDYRGSDTESRSLKQSLWVLGEIGGDSIVEAVACFIKDEQWQVRSAAYTALGKSQSKDALSFLIEGLDDSIAPVRKSAYYALGQLASEHEISYLIQGLGDRFFGVRYAAVEGLLHIGEPAINPLMMAIGESRLRDYFIFRVLCCLNGKSEDMLEFIWHHDPAVRQVVYEGLKDATALKRCLDFEKNELLKNYLTERLSELQ